MKHYMILNPKSIQLNLVRLLHGAALAMEGDLKLVTSFSNDVVIYFSTNSNNFVQRLNDTIAQYGLKAIETNATINQAPYVDAWTRAARGE